MCEGWRVDKRGAKSVNRRVDIMVVFVVILTVVIVIAVVVVLTGM